MGAMLCQADKEREERAIENARRGLLKHEKNYAPFSVEMQATV
jgi:hypothetical protein